MTASQVASTSAARGNVHAGQPPEGAVLHHSPSKTQLRRHAGGAEGGGAIGKEDTSRIVGGIGADRLLHSGRRSDDAVLTARRCSVISNGA